MASEWLSGGCRYLVELVLGQDDKAAGGGQQLAVARHQMALVRIARAEALHAVGALVGRLARVPPPVLLVVRRVAELPVAVGAREARQVGVDQHVVVERVLAREDGAAAPALVRLDAGVAAVVRQQRRRCRKRPHRCADLAVQRVDAAATLLLQLADVLQRQFPLGRALRHELGFDLGALPRYIHHARCLFGVCHVAHRRLSRHLQIRPSTTVSNIPFLST